MQDNITIRGARVHNLKNIDVTIPKNKLVVFTGVSGSGKSSLAFDTIYVEGQRRYVESLSSYARQFLGVMSKPDVDSMDGLSPAISIDQKTASHNPRSTVGTITEIYDYLRLLYARIGHPHCPSCGREVARQSVAQMDGAILEKVKELFSQYASKPVRFMILSPVVRDRKGEFTQMFENLRAKGYKHVRIDGHVFALSEEIILIKTNKHTIDAVIDRLSITNKMLKKDSELSEIKRRLYEDLEGATNLSDGMSIFSLVLDAAFEFPISPKKFQDHLYSEKFSCPYCNISLPDIEPRIFSFNSPHGACPTCSGIGKLLKVDPKIVINPRLTISEGGIIPFARMILSDTWFGRIVATAARHIGISLTKPLGEISAKELQQLLYGTGDYEYEVSGTNRYGKVVEIYEKYLGIVPELEKRYRETSSEYVRNEIGKYLRDELCPDCKGLRLKKEALAITVQGKSIVEICALSIRDTLTFIKQLNEQFSPRERTIANLIIKELVSRLSFLLSVGLDYLTLSRGAISLSGGEAQRIRLASQIGSGLSGVLYVLDEPSIGLHPRDNMKLIETLKELRDLGNTVIVVEHDREMMEHADLIYDFGPAAGEHGGKVIAQGTPGEIKKNPASLTGQYLSHKKNILTKSFNSTKIHSTESLVLVSCSTNNLKNITVAFPLNKFICVTGVSGSGKSSLVVDTLFHALAMNFNPYHRDRPGKFETIKGLENINRAILIDQSPIGRTPRSKPATYTGAFTYIRDLFAATAQARSRGYNAGRFSFNVKGGRCEACEGEGQTRIEMQFLPDVYVTCDVCNGTRYNSDTLEIKFKDKNIAEVLSMTVEEALSLFSNIPGLITKLETLYQVGLSYIRLGQSAPQLSGGEAQRVKLASELSKKGTRGTVYILDEPTTGLHFADIEKLLSVLRMLTDMGNTVIVIEHNLDVVKNADWIIDLGPEGGQNGGEIIAEGSVKTVIENKNSFTGVYLKKIK
jgi:excinuclease ABC subunit A